MVMGSRPRRRSAPSDVVLEGVPVVWASGVLVLEGPFSLSSPPPITRAAATPTTTAVVAASAPSTNQSALISAQHPSGIDSTPPKTGRHRCPRPLAGGEA